MDSKTNYEFLEYSGTDPSETCPIKIKGGQYDGIVFKYGKISLLEENDNLNVTMDIEMVNAPEDFNKNEQNFINIVGEIFVQIVESGVVTRNNESVDLEDDVHQDNDGQLKK